MSREQPNPDSYESLLAEDMTSVLDFVSRLMHGLEHGEWSYASDKTGELDAAATPAPTQTMIGLARQYAHHLRAEAVLYLTGSTAAKGRNKLEDELAEISSCYVPDEHARATATQEILHALRDVAPVGPEGQQP